MEETYPTGIDLFGLEQARPKKETEVNRAAKSMLERLFSRKIQQRILKVIEQMQKEEEAGDCH